jgi:hypothetical protein
MSRFRKIILVMLVAIGLAGIGFALPQSSGVATAASTTPSCVERTFQRGSYNICVGYIQTMTNVLVNGSGTLTIDKSYGPLTQA